MNRLPSDESAPCHPWPKLIDRCKYTDMVIGLLYINKKEKDLGQYTQYDMQYTSQFIYIYVLKYACLYVNTYLSVHIYI